MDRITLDREVFKALASDTRLDILKALDERQKTVTELGRELELNKATVFEHLEKLSQVGLVNKLEDERKWVYYQLSWTGRRLLHPDKITIALLLSTAGASLVTALAALWAWVTSRAAPAGGNGPAGEAGIMRAPVEAAPEPGPSALDDAAQDPVLLGVAIGLLLFFVVLTAVAALVWRRARRASATAA